MNKRLLLIFSLLSLATLGCENSKPSDNGMELSKSEQGEIRMAEPPLLKGEASFQKSGEEKNNFNIKIEKLGYKGFYPSGVNNGAHIVIDWSDGYTSAYRFAPDKNAIVFDYDKKTKKWNEGVVASWNYNGNTVEITSENGSVTSLGDLKDTLAPMIINTKEIQDEQRKLVEAERAKEMMYTDMSLKQLDKEFKQNRIRVRKNYEGKVITVRGQIDAIYDDKLTVCQKDSGECIQLLFNNLQRNKSGLFDWLADRETGDKVTVTGLFSITASMGEQTSSMETWKIVTGYTDSPLSLD